MSADPFWFAWCPCCSAFVCGLGTIEDVGRKVRVPIDQALSVVPPLCLECWRDIIHQLASAEGLYATRRAELLHRVGASISANTALRDAGRLGAA